jgi:predicted DNA-binding protein with PD1-like motif
VRAKILSENGARTFAIIFETGDEVMEGLLRFAEERDLDGSHFTAVGGFSNVTLAYFDVERKDYRKIPLNEQVEVLSLIGDIALNKGKPKVHAHVVVGRDDASVRGGHLMEAHVRPTLEVVLNESPEHLQRQTDPETGLALIRV